MDFLEIKFEIFLNSHSFGMLQIIKNNYFIFLGMMMMFIMMNSILFSTPMFDGMPTQTLLYLTLLVVMKK